MVGEQVLATGDVYSKSGLSASSAKELDQIILYRVRIARLQDTVSIPATVWRVELAQRRGAAKYQRKFQQY